MILDIISIAYILVFIISISNAVEGFKMAVFGFLFKSSYSDFSIKPFDCPLCMTWWCGLAYLLITHNFCLQNVAFVAIIAYFASKDNIIEQSFYTVSDLIIKLLGYANK